MRGVCALVKFSVRRLSGEARGKLLSKMSTNTASNACENGDSKLSKNVKSSNGVPSDTGNIYSSVSDKYPRKLSRGKNAIQVKSAVPKKRQDLLKWNGWGYKDSHFVVKDRNIRFTGNRYSIGEMDLPFFKQYVLSKFDLDINTDSPPPAPPPERYLETIVTQPILDEIKALGISFSVDGLDRLIRARGQALHDIAAVMHEKLKRLPDVVVWPTCHEEVVEIVKLADRRGLVIIPYGGGTSVSGAVECPARESRPIVSLDTSQMNEILWVDYENLVICCEGGILGQDLERELRTLGYTVGHEPDSYEFSSLGGWVATRASGMKKNNYGNIEDLVVHVKMVTPRGVLAKSCRAPRISCGPDFEQMILGSEGSLGVVTEVVLKIRPLPKCTRYGSVVFPDFENGVRCMREVARQRCQPSSIRLMDNEQFQFGQALKPVPSYLGLILDGLKTAYITKIKGFDLNKMCVTTLLYEGTEEDVSAKEKKINEIAIANGGTPAGAKNGERGYVLTFVIAYIRDLAFEHQIVAESFETSMPWDRTSALCRNVKHCITRECQRRKLRFMVSCRVTQTYDAGCCVYFYFGLKTNNRDEDPIAVYEQIEELARDEIIASGGSISHHHGVGKLRRKWYKDTVSESGLNLYKATKAELDPRNIFANENLTEDLEFAKSKL